ncbi:hypothetical protein ECZU31_17910 [Escherichia coli]|nr:hypothetical protein ECZU31_17910 [Escherichia coli]
MVCTYFRLTMDGKELVEIDTINMIEKVNGVDRLEQHRRNIGSVIFIRSARLTG